MLAAMLSGPGMDHLDRQTSKWAVMARGGSSGVEVPCDAKVINFEQQVSR